MYAKLTTKFVTYIGRSWHMYRHYFLIILLSSSISDSYGRNVFVLATHSLAINSKSQ